MIMDTKNILILYLESCRWFILRIIVAADFWIAAINSFQMFAYFF